MASMLEKTGKVVDVKLQRGGGGFLGCPDMTQIVFEDGTILSFYGAHGYFKIGYTYWIKYFESRSWGYAYLMGLKELNLNKSQLAEFNGEVRRALRELDVDDSMILGVTNVELANFISDTSTGKLRKIEASLFQ